MAASPARLKHRAEFLRAAQRGRKAAMPSLVVQAFFRGDDAPVRLGFTVTKKVGNSVVRNRTRRRMREAARLLLRDAAPSGVDLVLIGRDSTRKRPFPQLIEDFAAGDGEAGCGAAMSPLAYMLALCVHIYRWVLRPLLPPSLQVCTELQRIRDRGIAHPWRVARHLARRLARRALQPFCAGRLRPGARAASPALGMLLPPDTF